MKAKEDMNRIGTRILGNSTTEDPNFEELDAHNCLKLLVRSVLKKELGLRTAVENSTHDHDATIALTTSADGTAAGHVKLFFGSMRLTDTQSRVYCLSTLVFLLSGQK